MQRTLRLLVALGALAVASVSCASDTPVATATPSSQGPFLRADPGRVIVETFWIDPTGGTPALTRPIPEDEPGAVLLDADGGVVRIAVNGDGCVPTVHLTVERPPPELELLIEISESVPEPGLQCPALGTTHAFEVVLGAVPTHVTLSVVGSR